MKGPEHLYVTLPLAFIFFSSRPAARFIFAISLAISSPRPMPEALALPHFASAAGAPANSTNAASAQPPSAIPNKLFIASPPAGHGQGIMARPVGISEHGRICAAAFACDVADQSRSRYLHSRACTTHS